MGAMAKRKSNSGGEGKGEGKKRYPSRENTRYLAVPRAIYEALERYARSRSDEDEAKSVSWAGRVAIRKFLTAEGFWPPPPEAKGS